MKINKEKMKNLWILVSLLSFVFITTYAQDLNFNQTTVIMDSTINSPFLVCKLTGPELQKRKTALQKEIFSNVRKLEELDDGFLFYFEDKDDFLEKLMDYTLAEKKCCPFFRIGLTIKPDSEGIELKLTGPDGAKEMMKELVGSN